MTTNNKNGLIILIVAYLAMVCFAWLHSNGKFSKSPLLNLEELKQFEQNELLGHFENDSIN